MRKIKHLLLACLVMSVFMGISVTVVRAEEVKTTSLSSTSVRVFWEPVELADSYEVLYKEAGTKKFKSKGEIQETSINLKVKDKKEYEIKIIPKSDAEEFEEAELTTTFKNSYFVDSKHQKYSYSEMQTDIREICKKYSEYVSYTSIGKTAKGRKIYDVVLGNPNAKKSLLVVNELHAREYVTTVTCMRQLEYYLSNYNKKLDGKLVSDVFKNCNVHYIMMANPDGVAISQAKKPRWKGNSNGVNLNRNFPYKFKCQGKNTESYSGKKAASEKETKAIIAITKKLMKQKSMGVISYHSMGQIVFGSYKGSQAKDKKVKAKIKKMYDMARKTTGYADAGRADYGESRGCYREYLIYNLKIPCITIEVGSTPCPIPQKGYDSIYEKNKFVVLREADLL